MNRKPAPYLSLTVLILFNVIFSIPAFSEEDDSLLEVTPDKTEYAMNTVKPVLDSCINKDKLSVLLKTSTILIDPVIGIAVNKIESSKFIIYRLGDAQDSSSK